MVDKIIHSLNDRVGRPIKGAQILLIGIAYKKNTDDSRESPALKIMEFLERRGAEVLRVSCFNATVSAGRRIPHAPG